MNKMSKDENIIYKKKDHQKFTIKKNECLENLIRDKYGTQNLLNFPITDSDLKKALDDLYRDPESWKKPSNPVTPPAEPQKVLTNLEEILTPLDAVILDPQLKDDIIERCSVPELLMGEKPQYAGVILYGPPGTGKTVPLSAIAEVYSNTGSFSHEVSFANVNSKWLGEFAKNMQKLLDNAISEADRRGKPSFLYFDEGSVLTKKPVEGSTTANAYQEALDVLKRVIGNDNRVVVAISTNILPDSFEAALVRDGRLTSYFVGHPGPEEKRQLWQLFANKYVGMELNYEQASELAEYIPNEQGAFIEQFCRTYKATVKRSITASKGHDSLFDALKQGDFIREEEVQSTLTYDRLKDDVQYAVERKQERDYAMLQERLAQEPEKKGVGFCK